MGRKKGKKTCFHNKVVLTTNRDVMPPSFSTELGNQFDRWNSTKEKLQIVSNQRMARFLLDLYSSCNCKEKECYGLDDASVQVKREFIDDSYAQDSTTLVGRSEPGFHDSDVDEESAEPFESISSVAAMEVETTYKNKDELLSQNTEKPNSCKKYLKSNTRTSLNEMTGLKSKMKDNNDEYSCMTNNMQIQNNESNSPMNSLISDQTVELVDIRIPLIDIKSSKKKCKLESSVNFKNNKQTKKYRTRSGRITKVMDVKYNEDNSDISNSEHQSDDDTEFFCDTKDSEQEDDLVDEDPQELNAKYEVPKHLKLHETFMCWKCKVELSSIHDLSDHVLNCIDGLPQFDINCLHCDKTFSCVSAFCRHMLVVERLKVDETCWKCDQHFTHKPAWIRHFVDCFAEYRKQYKGQYTFACLFCNKPCRGVNNLIDHTRNKCKRHVLKPDLKDGEKFINDDEKDGDLYKCKICEKKFRSVSFYLNHVEICREKKCDLCGKEFGYLESFDYHVQNKICQKNQLSQFGDLVIRLHYKLDEEENEMKLTTNEGLKMSEPTDIKCLPFCCKTCSRYFDSKKSCDRHMRNCQNGIYKYACKNCGKFFKKDCGILSHLKKQVCTVPKAAKGEDKNDACKQVEKEVKDEICDQCGKVYSCRASFKQHLKLHHDKQYLKCEECGKQLSSKNSYRLHMAAHKGLNKPNFTCHVCGQSFMRNETYQSHMIKHTGVGNYKCSFCSKQFHYKCELVKHTRVHTGEKTYKCHFCNKHFRAAGNRKTHERLIHTKEFLHFCAHCKKGFAARNAMNAHANRCSLNPYKNMNPPDSKHARQRKRDQFENTTPLVDDQRLNGQETYGNWEINVNYPDKVEGLQTEVKNISPEQNFMQSEPLESIHAIHEFQPTLHGGMPYVPTMYDTIQ